MAKWLPGESGNPAGRRKGVPTKMHREIRELARGILDAQYWRLKYERIHAGTENPKIEALLLTYAFGAPPKEITGTGTVVHLGPVMAALEDINGHESPAIPTRTNSSGDPVPPLALLAMKKRDGEEPS